MTHRTPLPIQSFRAAGRGLRSHLRIALLCMVALAMLSLPLCASAGVRVASWNMKHLGWKGKDMNAAAKVIGHFDLVAIQEVMKPAAARQLAEIVSQQTGEPWGVTTSHLEGDSSYRESYAFLWRKSAVNHDGGDSAYIDPGNKFVREPFTAVFTTKDPQERLVLGTVHIHYGDDHSDRTAEIKVLNEYWRWMGQNYQGHRLLMGDFNMPPTDPSWRAMDALAEPSITHGASTLSKSPGQFANLYDNIWHSKADRLPITAHGIFDDPAVLGLTHKAAFAKISDHAPVYIVLGQASVDTTPVSGVHVAQASHTAAVQKSCVDINKASAGQLKSLDHVGSVTAGRIISHRPYHALSDLARVSGLSAGYVADIRRGGHVCALTPN